MRPSTAESTTGAMSEDGADLGRKVGEYIFKNRLEPVKSCDDNTTAGEFDEDHGPILGLRELAVSAKPLVQTCLILSGLKQESDLAGRTELPA